MTNKFFLLQKLSVLQTKRNEPLLLNIFQKIEKKLSIFKENRKKLKV